MINVLQAGRFIAAMAVVFHHAAISVAAFGNAPPALIYAVLEFGYLGVDFFFVLSGFIIHYTMHMSLRPAGRFAYDRLTRIMVPYWPVGIAVAAAYAILPGLSDSGREWAWLSTVSLIPTELPPALSVAWTLQHELAFYLIYALLFFSGRLTLGLAVWVLAIILAQVVMIPDLPLFQLVLKPINVEFVAGIAAASIFLNWRCVSGFASVTLSAALLLAFAVTGGDRTDSWLVGFAIAALLPWLCSKEAQGKFTVPSWLVWGGAASYAIYLVHNPLLSLTSRGMGAFEMGWPEAILASAVISAVAGWSYHLLWERPVMRMARWRDPRRASSAT